MALLKFELSSRFSETTRVNLFIFIIQSLTQFWYRMYYFYPYCILCMHILNLIRYANCQPTHGALICIFQITKTDKLLLRCIHKPARVRNAACVCSQKSRLSDCGAKVQNLLKYRVFLHGSSRAISMCRLEFYETKPHASL